MSSEQPPPYRPHFPEGSSAYPSALSSQPAAFPCSSYQTFPQNYTGGGDHSYYHGHHGPAIPPGHPGSPMTHHGYQGYQSGSHGPHGPPHEPHGPSHHWEGQEPYGASPKHTVLLVEQQDQGGGAEESCLAACSAALCCCFLWEMLTSHLC